MPGSGLHPALKAHHANVGRLYAFTVSKESSDYVIALTAFWIAILESFLNHSRVITYGILQTSGE